MTRALSFLEDFHVCKDSLIALIWGCRIIVVSFGLLSKFDNLLWCIMKFSIYTLSDLGVLSNLIGSLSLANEHYSPPTE